MFGRKKAAQEQPPYPQPPGEPATFHGFSGSPDKSVLATGLYQFYTDQNVLIQIHDSQCSKITFRPDRARLEMTFIFDDLRYAPQRLVPEARVNLLFDQVALLRWDGDTAAPDPGAPGGLVSDLLFGQPHFSDRSAIERPGVHGAASRARNHLAALTGISGELERPTLLSGVEGLGSNAWSRS